MAVNSIRQLPSEVRKEITDEKYIAIEQDIHRSFGLANDQIDKYNTILKGIYLGQYSVTELSSKLVQLPRSNSLDLRGLALETALKFLWPLQEYLGKVDLLITRLGGKMPAIQPLPKSNSEADKATQELMHGTGKVILQRHKNYEDLYLTQKPIKDDDDRLKVPSVKNWLNDYLHTMGAEGASSMKRSQYLAKSRNAVKLNDEEKKNILNFLVSYEEDVLMYWTLAEEQYLVVESDLPESKQEILRQDKIERELPQLLKHFKDVQQDYQQMFNNKQPGLTLEVGDHTAKLSDIVWEALGLADQDRALVALYILIERHSFWQMLKTDHRFQGIVARALDVNYGTEAKNFWDKDLTKPVMQSIFWKLILADKLKIEEDKAAIIADLYSKKLGQKISPLYLDRKSGQFLFRDVAYSDRRFRFA